MDSVGVLLKMPFASSNCSLGSDPTLVESLIAGISRSSLNYPPKIVEREIESGQTMVHARADLDQLQIRLFSEECALSGIEVDLLACSTGFAAAGPVFAYKRAESSRIAVGAESV
mmetsp:Transcript_30063/g.99486  ORF Transcript_30063/g.99486 Transcript_30063/m.99486 type:complete len:115 (+) Transcript_30063:203-547(+)|eukprot:CAMPEP_0203908320 /NCGR_PEP_ID=MMETSP0359-20131031/49729_1 /ASSEMBLY_ACC=CAM_ASM_000338 /TAXON_ID=268821 /ORGANISM="Scrippsiella Hangoei, Strain SHTV-5" /LENGTH=114 /DNA_ID=CAMNT_0050833299 /DNA_START=20 /DNA_END=360 /DNA_ORIENTATION=-